MSNLADTVSLDTVAIMAKVYWQNRGIVITAFLLSNMSVAAAGQGSRGSMH